MSHTPRDDRPPYDEELAASYVGKYILVGISYRDHTGAEIRRQQIHGVIESVSPAEGIVISMRGAYQGKSWVMPPILQSIRRAAPGNYTLETTGETIEDPDLLATWSVTQQADAKL